MDSETIQVEEGDIKILYEDKIKLLEKLLNSTEKELKSYQDSYGNL